MQKLKVEYKDNYSLEGEYAEKLMISSLNEYRDDEASWDRMLSNKAIRYGNLETFKVNDFFRCYQQFLTKGEDVLSADINRLKEYLHTGNKFSRNYFKDLTGIELGTTNKSMADALDKVGSSLKIVNKRSELHLEYVSPPIKKIIGKTIFSVGDTVWIKPYEQLMKNACKIVSMTMKNDLLFYLVKMPVDGNGNEGLIYLQEFMITPVSESGIKIFEAKFENGEFVFIASVTGKFKVISAEIDQSGEKQTIYKLEAISTPILESIYKKNSENGTKNSQHRFEKGVVYQDIPEHSINKWIDEEKTDEVQLYEIGDYVSGRTANIYRTGFNLTGKVVDVSYGNLDGLLTFDTFVYSVEQSRESPSSEIIIKHIYGKYANHLKKLSYPLFQVGSIVTIQGKSDAVKYTVEFIKGDQYGHKYLIRKSNDKFGVAYTYSENKLKLFVKGKKEGAEPKLKMIYMGATFMFEGNMVEVSSSSYDYDTKTTTWRINKLGDRLEREFSSRQLYDTDRALILKRKFENDARHVFNP